jgi:hypothetical protein
MFSVLSVGSVVKSLGIGYEIRHFPKGGNLQDMTVGR